MKIGTTVPRIPEPNHLEKALKRLQDAAEDTMIFVPVALCTELKAALAQSKVALHVAERDRLPFS